MFCLKTDSKKIRSALGIIAKATGTTLSTQTNAAINFARLFVEFTAAHFLFNAAAFNEFTETTNCILDGFILSQRQLDH